MSEDKAAMDDPIGDVSKWSTKLYGRDRETSLLCSSVKACWGGTNFEPIDDVPSMSAVVSPSETPPLPYIGCVLLAGARGSGKRVLVEKGLSDALDKGLLLSGRFPPDKQQCELEICSDGIDQCIEHPSIDVDQIQVAACAPFMVYIDALERIIVRMDRAVLDDVRAAVATNFAEHSSDREILSKILSPSLVQSLLSSDQHLAADASTMEQPNSVSPFGPSAMTFRRDNEQGRALARFLLVVSTCFPIVLHLEQVQYADAESLHVIQTLLQTDWEQNGGTETKGLLIVASYRDDVEQREPFAAFLREVNTGTEELRKRIKHVHVANLSWNDVYSWVRDRIFAPSQVIADQLTDLVHEVTKGNPQQIQYLLSILSEYGPLEADEALDVMRQRLPTSTDSLLSIVLAQLHSDLREVLDIAAALGDWTAGSFDHDVVEMVLQRPCAGALAQLHKSELLVLDGASIRFYRPELQALVYSLIPESNRASLHLKIGRRMWKNSSLGSKEEMDEGGRKLALIAGQLHRGLYLVADSEERNVIAVIHFCVGKQAMQASYFQSAVLHFEVAKQALGDDLWTFHRYELSLMLYNCLAEAQYCVGEFEAVEHTLDDVLTKAKTQEDKLQAYTTLVFANGARHRLKEAVAIALTGLAQLGEHIPPNPRLDTVALEYIRIRRMMNQKSDRYFLALPAAVDCNKIAAMQLLNFTFMYSYVVNPKCGAMALFRMLRLTLMHGISGPGVTAFSGYGLLLCGFGRIEESYRFGQIAINLLDQLDGNGKAWVSRVFFVVFGMINPCSRPIRESLQPLQFAHQSALKTGDIEGSVVAAGTYLSLSFHTSTPLSSLEAEIRSHCQLMQTLGQTFCLIFLVPLWGVVCKLTETSVLLLDVTGSVTDAESARDMAFKEGNKTALSMYYGAQTIGCCFFGEYATALEMAQKSEKLASEKDFHLIFYFGVAALSLARSTERCTLRRRRFVSTGRSCIRQLRKWARICPANIVNKQYLLEAELAALRGDSTKALFLFNESIKEASKEGFLHEQGLAYERLAQYHVHLGHCHTVAPYFDCARDIYSSWGATALVRRMESFRATIRATLS